MGQEVKNLLRAQSKYGLMGSSAKTGKKIFRGSQEHFLHKSAIRDRTPPHLHIKCSLHVCGRVQGSQIFKQNSIISFRSKVMAILVISLSPCGPHGPHIIPVIPTSSPHHLHCPHIIPITPIRFPCDPHGCGLCGLHPMLSPWSPCHSHHPHIVPTSSRRSPHHPQPSQIPTPPTPTPLGWGMRGPESVKMQ